MRSNYVSNFTDVDDKIIKKAIEEGVSADEDFPDDILQNAKKIWQV